MILYWRSREWWASGASSSMALMLELRGWGLAAAGLTFAKDALLPMGGSNNANTSLLVSDIILVASAGDGGMITCG